MKRFFNFLMHNVLMGRKSIWIFCVLLARRNYFRVSSVRKRNCIATNMPSTAVGSLDNRGVRAAADQFSTAPHASCESLSNSVTFAISQLSAVPQEENPAPAGVFAVAHSYTTDIRTT